MKPRSHFVEAVFLLIATNFAVLRGAPLVTSQNSAVSVPAAGIASTDFAGLTNLVGSNFIVSAVMPVTLRGGRASLIGSQQWERRYNGGTFSWQNAVYGMASQSDGVVVTGPSLGSTTGYDFATVSYATDGTPLWTNRYDGPGHGNDSSRLLAVNASGDVWVVGESMRYPTNYTLTDVAVVKYASNGIPLWTNRYASFDTNGAYPIALAVDRSGNAYVEQSAAYWQPSGVGRPVEDSITKYDALGNVVWTKRYLASAPDSGQDLHELGPMALDDAGNLFVAGTTGSEHFNTGASIVKFAGDGTTLWINHYPRQVVPGFQLLSVDPQGNAILTGESFSNGAIAYVVMKCSKDGASLWTNVLAGPTYDGGSVPQTVSDPAGNVFVIGGRSGASSPGIYQILKVTADGIPLWTNQAPDFHSPNGVISSSAVDSAGNLYVVGSASAPNSSNTDYVTVKFSAAGQPLWTNRFNGAANLNDNPFGLGLDGAGNIYVAGQSESQPGQNDFATVKYTDLLSYAPPENFTGSDAIACTVTDSFGNSATGSVEVLVVPVPFQFSRSQAAIRLTPAGMQLQLQGAPGTNPVVLAASVDLISWQSILTNAPENGSVGFLDPAALSLPHRFYRASQQSDGR